MAGLVARMGKERAVARLERRRQALIARSAQPSIFPLAEQM